MIIIDGNNLLHAMHAHAPLPSVGRETLVRIVERWARQSTEDVVVVFDGPLPRGGMRAQLASKRIDVRFSESRTADEIIVRMLAKASNPSIVEVVTSDKAIQHAARGRRCHYRDTKSFIDRLFGQSAENTPAPTTPSSVEKPPPPSVDQADDWLETFGLKSEDDEPFDGFEAMTQ